MLTQCHETINSSIKNSLFLYQMAEDGVVSDINVKNLNWQKSTRYNDTPTKLFKLCKTALSTQLIRIFNLSLE